MAPQAGAASLCLLLATRLTAVAGERMQRDETAFLERSREVFEIVSAAPFSRTASAQEAPRGIADYMPSPNEVPLCLGVDTKWTYTGTRLGGGMVAGVWVVKGPDGKIYAMKGMRIRPKGTERHITKGIVPTLQGFAEEVAAQSLAAEMHLAPKVIDYFVCRHPTKSSPTLGFIVMQQIKGSDLGVYVNSQGSKAGIWCERKYLAPASSIKGFVTREMYDQIVDGIHKLDQAGIYITDMHPGNIMVESHKGIARVFFIDFGYPSGCTYQNGQAVLETLDHLGCPVRGDLIAPSGSFARHEEGKVLLKSNDWWRRAEVLEDHADGTYGVKDFSGNVQDNVSTSHLFRMVFIPECINERSDGGSEGSGDFDFLLDDKDEEEEEDPFEDVLADLRIH